MRVIGDGVKDQSVPVVAILSSVNDEKATILVAASKSAVGLGVHSGNLIKQMTALIGGSGGGRPDSAMGGTSEIYRIDEALTKADEFIATMIQNKK